MRGAEHYGCAPPVTPLLTLTAVAEAQAGSELPLGGFTRQSNTPSVQFAPYAVLTDPIGAPGASGIR